MSGIRSAGINIGHLCRLAHSKSPSQGEKPASCRLGVKSGVAIELIWSIRMDRSSHD